MWILTRTSPYRCYASTENLYRVRRGYNSHNLRQPPAIVRAFTRPSTKSGNHSTRMDRHGWEDYLRKLNGKKFDASIHSRLAMFNNQHGMGWPKMKSLFFAGNILRAVPTDKRGWLRIVTLDYASGPPEGMPTFRDNPIYVMEFTLNDWGAEKLLTRGNRLYYPVVSTHPVYMPVSRLEPFSLDMETQMPT